MSETYEQTFSVSSPAEVVVKNVRGSILVKAGAEGQVVAKAIKHTDSGNDSRTEVSMEQEADGRVKIKARYKDTLGGIMNFQKPCKVDFTVIVPPACNLSVNSVSCDVSVEEVHGTLEVETVSGDVSLVDLEGDLHLQSVSGDLSGKNLVGPLRLRTVSGDVSLKESHFPSVEANSVSGEVALETPISDEGAYDFKSVSGNVRLNVPEDARCTLNISSLSGRIRTPGGATRHASHGPGRRHQKVEINGGGSEVRLNSVSGDLLVNGPVVVEDDSLANPEPVMVPATPVPEEPALTRAEVLEKIGRGEISVDEAVEALRNAR